MNQIKITILATIVMTILFGLAYPLVFTGLAQVLFPHQANGSLVTVNGKVAGSELIGQSFTMPLIPADRISGPPTRSWWTV